MKKLYCIRSSRKYEKWPSFDLIYEWEDVIEEKMNVSIKSKSYFRYFNKVIDFLGFNPFRVIESAKRCRYELVWDMTPNLKVNRYENNYFIIPCIIDYFLLDSDFRFFQMAYNKNSYVLVSNIEAFNHLKLKGMNNVIHFPLSISDKYKLPININFKKKYDLVLLGRTNPILEEFLSTYLLSHPDFLYVYRECTNNKFLYFTSKGECLGNISTREKYIELMRSAKIGFYSTPGIDGGELRTNGYNPVTPRFLELLACGCHVIARYKENEDTEFYELKEFCNNINTYDDFKKSIDDALTKEVDLTKYSEYLNKHYTSKRIEILNSFLKQNYYE